MGAGDGELSPSFLTANRGKRSLAINLKDKKGTEIIKKLVLDADVFVQNFRPGVIDRIGLGYEVFNVTHNINSVSLTTEQIIKKFFPNVKMRREMGEYESILSSKKIRDILGFNPVHDWKNYCKGDL